MDPLLDDLGNLLDGPGIRTERPVRWYVAWLVILVLGIFAVMGCLRYIAGP